MTETQLLKVLERAFYYFSLRVPYVFGGEDSTGMDCSGYMQVIHGEAGIKIPRTSLQQSTFCTKVELGQQKFGDKLFFDTDGDGKVNHVGLYLGSNIMIHTANKERGIEIVNLKDYYGKKLVAVRRF